jgi:DNA repair exonuclease SbcCD ATPase subunit
MKQTGGQQQQSKAEVQPFKQVWIDAETQTNTLLELVQEAKAEQTALFEATQLESQYNAGFAALVEEKHDQVERIEDKLENLIDLQASRLQQTQAKQPGILALPGARAKWQQQLQQQQNTLRRLHGRLESVREIKDGMGVHGPRIEELAIRKLRTQEPELAREWDDMQEAQRLHQALQRKQEKEKKTWEREQLSRGGLRLGFSQTTG